MAKATFEIQNVDNVKTLIELLSKYKGDLPQPLLDSLKELADCESCEYNISSLHDLGVNPYKVDCFFDGEEVKGVVSINVILKRVTVYPDVFDGKEHPEVLNGVFVSAHKYPKSFELKDSDNKLVIGW